MTNHKLLRKAQRGASVVEFALILPILFVILFGIIEFGWTFYQVLDTRHGAREAARLIAVDYEPTDGSTPDEQRDDLIEVICTRIEDPAVSRISVSLVTAGNRDAGDLAMVRVEKDLEQVTNFFGEFLDSVTPNSEVTFRLERDASWSETAGLQSCP